MGGGGPASPLCSRVAGHDDGAAAVGACGQAPVGFRGVVEGEAFDGDVEDAGVGEVDEFDQFVAGAPVRCGDGGFVGADAEADAGGGLSVAEADDGDVGGDACDGHGGVDGGLVADEVQHEGCAGRSGDGADVVGGRGVGQYRFVGADGFGEGKFVVGDVEGDHAGR